MASQPRFDQAALAREILDFWFAPKSRGFWFRKSAAFDAEIAARFGVARVAAASGALDAMRATPQGALALLILLDQFSRNLHRKSARAFAHDAQARRIANEAIGRRFDMIAEPLRRGFFYLPFMHSEDLRDQERSVALYTARLAGSGNLAFAHEHARIIRRFGRFPHRNAVLQRASTAEESAFLKAGGFSG